MVISRYQDPAVLLSPLKTSVLSVVFADLLLTSIFTEATLAHPIPDTDGLFLFARVRQDALSSSDFFGALFGASAKHSVVTTGFELATQGTF